MKKLLVLTSLLALSTVSMAKGGFQDNNHHQGKQHIEQGFIDESLTVRTVQDALNASDNSPVVLVGSIVKQIDDNEFLFKDSTGQVEIDVSKRAWNGQTITPQDTIEIHGFLDKEWNKTEIDVKKITKK